MSQSIPSFWDSPYFVPEPDNWHLTEDAPEELKKEFAEYMENEKGIKVRQLFSEVDFPPTMTQFFDLDSDELLDEKIAVLTALKDGKQIADIPTFYDILELYPKDGEHWDYKARSNSRAFFIP